jgi:hypothetical protein
MPPSNLGHTRSNGRLARGGGARRQRHGQLTEVEPKAHFGGPSPSGLGPTQSMEHGVLTSGNGEWRWTVRWCVWWRGFFLELRRRWGTTPRLLWPWFFSWWWWWRLLFLDDRSEMVGARENSTAVSG